MLGLITGAGRQEGAHHHVPAPGDILTRNGFELPGTGRAQQEYLGPTYSDLPFTPPPLTQGSLHVCFT